MGCGPEPNGAPLSGDDEPIGRRRAKKQGTPKKSAGATDCGAARPGALPKPHPITTHRITKGFAGASSEVLIQTDLVSRNSWMASMPFSRPMPDFFMPPKGIM